MLSNVCGGELGAGFSGAGELLCWWKPSGARTINCQVVLGRKGATSGRCEMHYLLHRLQTRECWLF